nr:MAG TPA_asm: hypothetical protein [Caudoviricetes sp.]
MIGFKWSSKSRFSYRHYRYNIGRCESYGERWWNSRRSVR